MPCFWSPCYKSQSAETIQVVTNAHACWQVLFHIATSAHECFFTYSQALTDVERFCSAKKILTNVEVLFYTFTSAHESVYGMMCARNLAFISMTKYSVDPASLSQAFVFQSHQDILRSSILESWVWSKEERVLDLGGLYRCPLELSGPGISCLIEGHDGGPSFARLRCGRRIKLLAALVCFYNRIDMNLKVKSAWNYLLACLPWSSCLQTFLLAAGLCGHLHHEPWRCLP